ncbi:ABC transporter substrate-binding protein [Rhodospirillaceae bacterium SYSU D60014]|uniref:ABC transporter substrate-binding protein n=1 Tax=Virgifigura deserti TaxID=2268457 RepID=UPI000E66BF6C
MKRLALVVILTIVALAGASPPAAAADPLPDWDEIVAEARGQTVYWNAWGGSDRTNDYIAWVKERVAEDYGVTLQHIKLADTAEAVSRVLAEKVSGRTEGGSVDLIWINGENFAAMKAQDLLFGPFTQVTPNYALVDTKGKPTTLFDFTIPVDGLEAPWGMAQIVFLYDTAYVEDPPRSMPAFLDWARAHPGRFTYPQPPDFTGSTFLKQALYELATDRGVLQEPATAESFATVTAPLWNWLDALHPHLWRDGQTFPQNAEVQRQMLDDGVIELSLSFYPSDASSAIAKGLLPDTVRTYVLDGGTIGNTHFVAIPFNASAKEGAMVVANFLMSPEAQLHKQDPEVWGDQTVLAMDKLDPADRKRFEELPRGIATLAPAELGPVLLEPHPSWMTRLEAEWRRRYGH